MEAHQLQPRRPAARRSRGGTRASDLMRGVNGNVRRLADALPRPEEVAFFCECQNPTCYSAVWMSRTAFDAKTAAGGGWLLLDGHEPSAPRQFRPARRRDETASRSQSLMSA